MIAHVVVFTEGLGCSLSDRLRPCRHQGLVGLSVIVVAAIKEREVFGSACEQDPAMTLCADIAEHSGDGADCLPRMLDGVEGRHSCV